VDADGRETTMKTMGNDDERLVVVTPLNQKRDQFMVTVVFIFFTQELVLDLVTLMGG